MMYDEEVILIVSSGNLIYNRYGKNHETVQVWDCMVKGGCMRISIGNSISRLLGRNLTLRELLHQLSFADCQGFCHSERRKLYG